MKVVGVADPVSTSSEPAGGVSLGPGGTIVAQVRWCGERKREGGQYHGLVTCKVVTFKVVTSKVGCHM